MHEGERGREREEHRERERESVIEGEAEKGQYPRCVTLERGEL